MVLRARTEAREYLLQRRIAAGGMGEVYRAESPADGRTVAVKRMLEHTAGDEDLLRLFLREMMVASTLEHHNVVEVLDVGRSGHELFLVMELVDGPTLAEVLECLRADEKRPPLDVAIGIAMHIAQGLTHAHERALPDGTPLGIVHRDIAPENVLIGPDGVAKLVDFGLAKLDGQQLTQPGVIRGRPRSLAPEQARGDDTDARTDIFALGAILFEMMSGDRLYPDESVATLLWKVAAGDYESIRARMPEADPDIVAIVERAVAVDKKDRHSSARQVERELGAFRASREMRVSNRDIAQLVATVWPAILRRREATLDGAGELEGRTLTLPADALPAPHGHRDLEVDEASLPKEPAKVGMRPERWRRPKLPPRPEGWDRVTPLPEAPAHLGSPELRTARAWNRYGYTLMGVTTLTFLITWWLGA